MHDQHRASLLTSCPGLRAREPTDEQGSATHETQVMPLAGDCNGGDNDGDNDDDEEEEDGEDSDDKDNVMMVMRMMTMVMMMMRRGRRGRQAGGGE